MKSGIYRIVNLINGKFYIGSSVNCLHRKGQHFSKLKLNKHYNKHLQKSYNKHGKDNFHFEIIEFCEKDQLLILEQKYIDELKPEYNLNTIVGNTLANHPNKKEICLKISQTHKLRFSKMTKEQRSLRSFMSEEDIKEKFGGRYKEKCNSWKGGKTYFTCPICGIEKRKSSTQNRKNCTNCRPSKKVKINNKIYDSVNAASKELNLTINCIHGRIKSKNFNYSYC